jgi:integrase
MIPARKTPPARPDRVIEPHRARFRAAAPGRTTRRGCYHYPERLDKGRKERISPLQAPAITALRLWQRENPAAPSAFVLTARGTARKMSTDAVAERIKDPRRGGGRRMSRHRRQERHPACPAAFRDAPLDRGGPEGDLMELNGWSSPQMLRRYGASARSARARRTYDRIMDDSP